MAELAEKAGGPAMVSRLGFSPCLARAHSAANGLRPSASVRPTISWSACPAVQAAARCRGCTAKPFLDLGPPTPRSRPLRLPAAIYAGRHTRRSSAAGKGIESYVPAGQPAPAGLSASERAGGSPSVNAKDVCGCQAATAHVDVGSFVSPRITARLGGGRRISRQAGLDHRGCGFTGDRPATINRVEEMAQGLLKVLKTCFHPRRDFAGGVCRATCDPRTATALPSRRALRRRLERRQGARAVGGLRKAVKAFTCRPRQWRVSPRG